MTVLRSLGKSIVRKRNFVSAEVVFEKLHSSITLEIWKRSARQIRACCPSRPFQTLWILAVSLCQGPRAFSLLWVSFPDVLVSSLPSARVVSEACVCVRSQPFRVPVTCLMCGSWLALSSFGNWRRSWPRSHPLRTWSLTGCRTSWSLGSSRQSLLWSRFLPAALLRPRSRSRSPLPKAAPGRPRRSTLLSQRGPAGLSVKSCPATPPDRWVSTDRRSGSPASAVGRLGALSVWPAPLPHPSPASRLLTQVRLPPGRLAEVAPLAPLRQGVANVTSTAGERHVTLNARCGVRFGVKTLPALQCGPAAPIPHPMMMSTTPATPSCSCLPTPSSRPPCSRNVLRWTSSFMVALSCRFALDIFHRYSARPASPRNRPSGS